MTTEIQSDDLTQIANEIRHATTTFRKAFSEFIAMVGPGLELAKSMHSTGGRGSTWATWCRSELGWSANYASRLIAAHEVMQKVVPIGTPLPTSESQCRELAKVGDDNIADAWRAVVEKHEHSDDNEITQRSIANVLAHDDRFHEHFAPTFSEPEQRLQAEELILNCRDTIWGAVQRVEPEHVASLVKIVRSEIETIEANTLDRQPKQVHVSHNSGENEWYTPPKYITAARAVMGGIDLDPASSAIAQRTVKATTFYTKKTNGLTKDWSGNVWLNPPYARELIPQFIEKLCTEPIGQACVLVNNSTDSSWFQTLTGAASCICFPSSRIKFLAPDGRPGDPLQGQAIVYIGNRKKKFQQQFSKFGFCVEVQ